MSKVDAAFNELVGALASVSDPLVSSEQGLRLIEARASGRKFLSSAQYHAAVLKAKCAAPIDISCAVVVPNALPLKNTR
jgi:hypothetical protein